MWGGWDSNLDLSLTSYYLSPSGLHSILLYNFIFVDQVVSNLIIKNKIVEWYCAWTKRLGWDYLWRAVYAFLFFFTKNKHFIWAIAYSPFIHLTQHLLFIFFWAFFSFSFWVTLVARGPNVAPLVLNSYSLKQ